ncbi:MAG: hypothetical protein ABJ118_17480, partial [Luteolibacter sp.]
LICPPTGKIQHRHPLSKPNPRQPKHLPQQHPEPTDVPVNACVGKWKPLDHARQTLHAIGSEWNLKIRPNPFSSDPQC